MAARVANTSGLWSNPATWSGVAVPVDGDSFTINASVVVEFDVDQSGMATGMLASTINGTLFASRAAGSYYLKMAGSLTWGAAATFDVTDGSNGDYPSTCGFTQKFGSGAFGNVVVAGTVVNLRCVEPTNKWLRLTAASLASATSLTVDTDITGEALYWKNGDALRISDFNGLESVVTTINGTPSASSLPVANAGPAKIIGAHVHVINRNVKIIGNALASGTAFTGASSSFTCYAQVQDFSVGYTLVVNAVIGGVIENVTTQVSATASGDATVHAVLGGGTSGLNGNQGHILETDGAIFGIATGSTALRAQIKGRISGCTSAVTGANSVITGTLYGNGIALNGAGIIALGATISGNTDGVGDRGEGVQLIDCTLSANTRDFNSTQGMARAFNTLFGAATEFQTPTSVMRSVRAYSESFDHDQIAGDYKAWLKGGNIANLLASPPPSAAYSGQLRANLHTPVSATFPVYHQQEVRVPAGATIYVRAFVRKDVTMAYLPRLWVHDHNAEPLISGSPNAEAIMTDSIDTWELLQITLTNTSNAPKNYLVRTLAKNASGNVWFDPVIRLSGYAYPLGAAS